MKNLKLGNVQMFLSLTDRRMNRMENDNEDTGICSWQQFLIQNLLQVRLDSKAIVSSSLSPACACLAVLSPTAFTAPSFVFYLRARARCAGMYFAERSGIPMAWRCSCSYIQQQTPINISHPVVLPSSLSCLLQLRWQLIPVYERPQSVLCAKLS